MEIPVDDREWFERFYGLTFRWCNANWVVAHACEPNDTTAEWRGYGEAEGEAFANLLAYKRQKEARDEYARRHYTGTNTSTFRDFNWH
jgi:hypothetical protein